MKHVVFCRLISPVRRQDGSLKVNVNISKRQLTEPNFESDVQQILREHGVDGSRLNFEVTESTITDEHADIDASLQRLKALGLSIHLDDFGTGMSSLSSLHRFPHRRH